MSLATPTTAYSLALTIIAECRLRVTGSTRAEKVCSDVIAYLNARQDGRSANWPWIPTPAEGQDATWDAWHAAQAVRTICIACGDVDSGV